MRCTVFGLVLTALTVAGDALAEPPPLQTEADEYTRYELLDPATASFRITYEVTATTPGATAFFNPIRKGSTATDEAVVDRLTGKPLGFDIVPGATARAGGLADADLDTSYIRITLARPVPKDGEARLLILKTYRDPKSYFPEGDTIVFSRSLGIKRNAVVLPVGYEVVACNYPSQVFAEPVTPLVGGVFLTRLRLSFMNIGPDAVSYVVKARRIK